MVTKEPRTTSTLSIDDDRGRRPRTPLLKANPKKQRLEFAKMHIDKPPSFWKNVLWTGETQLSSELGVHKT